MLENQAKKNYVAATLLGLAILITLLVLEILVATVLIGSLPTDIFIYPFRRFDFYQILWQSSPWATVKLLLVEKAILIVEQRDNTGGIQLWGMFFFTTNLLLHGSVALLAGVGWTSGRFRTLNKPMMQFAFGIFFLILASSYVRVATHCGPEPGWIVDVWLLSYVYDPLASPNWSDIYQSVERLFVPTQTLLLIVGALLMFHGWKPVRS